MVTNYIKATSQASSTTDSKEEDMSHMLANNSRVGAEKPPQKIFSKPSEADKLESIDQLKMTGERTDNSTDNSSSRTELKSADTSKNSEDLNNTMKIYNMGIHEKTEERQVIQTTPALNMQAEISGSSHYQPHKNTIAVVNKKADLNLNEHGSSKYDRKPTSKFGLPIEDFRTSQQSLKNSLDTPIVQKEIKSTSNFIQNTPTGLNNSNVQHISIPINNTSTIEHNSSQFHKLVIPSCISRPFDSSNYTASNFSPNGNDSIIKPTISQINPLVRDHNSTLALYQPNFEVNPMKSVEVPEYFENQINSTAPLKNQYTISPPVYKEDLHTKDTDYEFKLEPSQIMAQLIMIQRQFAPLFRGLRILDMEILQKDLEHVGFMGSYLESVVNRMLDLLLNNLDLDTIMGLDEIIEITENSARDNIRRLYHKTMTPHFGLEWPVGYSLNKGFKDMDKDTRLDIISTVISYMFQNSNDVRSIAQKTRKYLSTLKISPTNYWLSTEEVTQDGSPVFMVPKLVVDRILDEVKAEKFKFAVKGPKSKRRSIQLESELRKKPGSSGNQYIQSEMANENISQSSEEESDSYHSYTLIHPDVELEPESESEDDANDSTVLNNMLKDQSAEQVELIGCGVRPLYHSSTSDAQIWYIQNENPGSPANIFVEIEPLKQKPTWVKGKDCLNLELQDQKNSSNQLYENLSKLKNICRENQNSYKLYSENFEREQTKFREQRVEKEKMTKKLENDEKKHESRNKSSKDEFPEVFLGRRNREKVVYNETLAFQKAMSAAEGGLEFGTTNKKKDLPKSTGKTGAKSQSKISKVRRLSMPTVFYSDSDSDFDPAKNEASVNARLKRSNSKTFKRRRSSRINRETVNLRNEFDTRNDLPVSKTATEGPTHISSNEPVLVISASNNSDTEGDQSNFEDQVFDDDTDGETFTRLPNRRGSLLISSDKVGFEPNENNETSGYEEEYDDDEIVISSVNENAPDKLDLLTENNGSQPNDSTISARRFTRSRHASESSSAQKAASKPANMFSREDASKIATAKLSNKACGNLLSKNSEQEQNFDTLQRTDVSQNNSGITKRRSLNGESYKSEKKKFTRSELKKSDDFEIIEISENQYSSSSDIAKSSEETDSQDSSSPTEAKSTVTTRRGKHRSKKKRHSTNVTKKVVTSAKKSQSLKDSETCATVDVIQSEHSPNNELLEHHKKNNKKHNYSSLKRTGTDEHSHRQKKKRKYSHDSEKLRHSSRLARKTPSYIMVGDTSVEVISISDEELPANFRIGKQRKIGSK